MSELQNDSEVIEPDNAPIENQDNGTDLATVSEAEHEQTPQVDEEAAKQEAIQKAINKKHFEAKQAERERDEALAKIADFEKKQQEQLAASIGSIPELPDEWDDNYAEKIKARDEALIRKANFDAQQALTLQQQQYQQQQEQAKQQQELQEKMTSYTANATKLGISNEELQLTGNNVAAMGASEALQMAILTDPDGPLIAKHLSANPMDMQALNNPNIYIAGQAFIDVKAKANALKPKTSNAPSPAESVQGNGVDAELNKHPALQGVKYE